MKKLLHSILTILIISPSIYAASTQEDLELENLASSFAMAVSAPIRDDRALDSSSPVTAYRESDESTPLWEQTAKRSSILVTIKNLMRKRNRTPFTAAPYPAHATGSNGSARGGAGTHIVPEGTTTSSLTRPASVSVPSATPPLTTAAMRAAAPLRPFLVYEEQKLAALEHVLFEFNHFGPGLDIDKSGLRKMMLSHPDIIRYASYERNVVRQILSLGYSPERLIKDMDHLSCIMMNLRVIRDIPLAEFRPKMEANLNLNFPVYRAIFEQMLNTLRISGEDYIAEQEGIFYLTKPFPNIDPDVREDATEIYSKHLMGVVPSIPENKEYYNNLAVGIGKFGAFLAKAFSSRDNIRHVFPSDSARVTHRF